MGEALGYRYRSPAILLDVPDDGSPVTNPFASTGLPGTRAPHLVISRAGKLLSTIDLFGAHFVLLAGPDGDAWMAAAASAAASRSLPIDLYRMGAEIFDEEGEWSSPPWRGAGWGRAGSAGRLHRVAFPDQRQCPAKRFRSCAESSSLWRVAWCSGGDAVNSRKISNPLALAVLACLFERPMHPYEVAITLRERRKDESIKLNSCDTKVSKGRARSRKRV